MLHFPHFFIFNKFSAINAFRMRVKYDKTKQTLSNKICYDIYIYNRYNIRTHVFVFLFSVKKTRIELSRV